MAAEEGIMRWTHVPGVGDAAPLGYAHAVATRDLVFVAGQSGIDAERRVVAGDTAGQARRAFENVGRVLQEAGSSLEQILNITVYLAEGADVAAFLRVRAEFLSDNLPASTLISGVRFFDPAWLVEVNAIALAGSAQPSEAESG
jgi:2-iminobutanoate/2-iminopropanoate deaminase